MDIVVITQLAASNAAGNVLPALDLLPHRAQCVRPDPAMFVSAPPRGQILLLDARTDLADARSHCRLLQAAGLSVPLVAVLTEAGLAAVHADWDVDDVILTGAGPAEVEARLRLAVGRIDTLGDAGQSVIRVGDLAIDPDTYAAKMRGAPLDLTYKEFELLRFLAQHPGRVFSRDQLLREVWGYDYFGGTRTVDVHIRRLRAKLGSESESLIGTVRQVGYKFVAPATKSAPKSPATNSLNQ